MIFFNCDSNTIQQNTQFVYLQSHKGDSKNCGLYLDKDNFRKCISLLNARSLIKSTWKTSNDVYYTPKGILK